MTTRNFPLRTLIFSAALPLLCGLASGCNKTNANACQLTSFTQDAAPATGEMINNGSQTYLAQTFYVPSTASPAGTTTISNISIRVTKQGTGFSTNPNANTLTMTLREDASSGITATTTAPQPSGTNATGSAPVSVDLLGVPSGESYVKFNFPSAVTIQENATYWIVLTAAYQETASASNPNYVEWMNYNGTTIYTYGSAFGDVPPDPYISLGTQTYFEFIVTNC